MRWTFPQDRLVYSFFPRSPLYPVLPGTPLVVYTDQACTLLADIQLPDGTPISGSVLHIGDDTLVPIFLGPDTTAGSEVRSLWARPTGSTHTYRLDASLADRVALIEQGQQIDPTDLVTNETLASTLGSYQSLSTKGEPGGYASLGSDGKVPSTQVNLPDLSGLQPIDERGRAGGYASLGDDGKVPSAQLPEIPPSGVQTVNGKTGPDVGLAVTDIPGAVSQGALTTTLADYATITDLATKADASALADYVTIEASTAELATKADIAALSDFVTNDDLTTDLATKADTSALANYATTTALSSGLAAKADASALANYATTTALSSGLAGKVDTATLAGYATTAALASGLSTKADNSALAAYQPLSARGNPNGYASLGSDGKVPTAQLPPAPDLSGYQQTAQKNTANGYAGLSASGLLSAAQIPDLGTTYAKVSTLAPVALSGSYGDLSGLPTIPTQYSDLIGQVPSSALPDLAITDVFVVADETTMLALPAHQGDVAKRLDTGDSYILSSDSPTTLADWILLSAGGSGGGAVSSVNGLTGDVVVNWGNLSGKPTFATVATTGVYTDLTGRPALATVATSGAYTDLTARPVLAPVATSGLYSDLTGTPALATVATSGSYADLTSKPTIPTTAADVGAVPTSRLIAGHALTADVSLSAADVGAPSVFNVKAYAATGGGTVDDSAHIQAAITAAIAAGGGIVWFPSGTYLIGTTLEIDSAIGVKLAGPGELLNNVTGAPMVRFRNCTYCGTDAGLQWIGQWRGSSIALELDGCLYGDFTVRGDQWPVGMNVITSASATQNCAYNDLTLDVANGITGMFFEGDGTHFASDNRIRRITWGGAGSGSPVAVNFAQYADSNHIAWASIDLNVAGSIGALYNSVAPGSDVGVYENDIEYMIVQGHTSGTIALKGNVTTGTGERTSFVRLRLGGDVLPTIDLGPADIQLFNTTDGETPYTGKWFSGDYADLTGRPAAAPYFNVKDFGAVGNGTTDDTNAIKAAVAAAQAAGGGTVLFPQGNFKMTDRISLTAGPPLRFIGSGAVMNDQGTANATILTASGSSVFFFSHTSSLVSGTEVGNLSIVYTGTGHVFDDINLQSGYFHDLNISTSNAGSAAFFTNTTETANNSVINCTFERIIITTTASVRTVPMISFTSQNSGGISDVSFIKCKFNNNGNDSTQPAVLVACTATAGYHYATTFRDCYFEKPLGGAIRSLSGTGLLVENCMFWDMHALTIGGSSVYVGAGSGAVPSQGVRILGCGRNRSAHNGTSTWDIECEAASSQVQIEGFHVLADTPTTQTNAFFNLHGCHDVLLANNVSPQGSAVNGNSTTVITNPSPSQIRLSEGLFSSTARYLQVGPGNFDFAPSVSGGGPNSGYLGVDKNNTASDASVVLRDQGAARAEIGLAGDNRLHMKTVAGPAGSEVFTDRLVFETTGEVWAPGKFGVGTIPTERLHVSDSQGAARVYAKIENSAATGSASSGLWLKGHSADWSLVTDFALNGGDNLGISSNTLGYPPVLAMFGDGRVGIDTDAPGAELDVNGDVLAHNLPVMSASGDGWQLTFAGRSLFLTDTDPGVSASDGDYWLP